MVWEINIVHGLMLTSQGIIAALLSMLLGRLARWDRQRIAQVETTRPTPQEALLVEFCEAASIGMCSVAPSGRIVWANKAELQLSGYSHAEYVGRHITEFHVDPAAISEILRRLRAGEEFHDYESRIRCRDGTVKQVLIDSNICRRDGEISGTRFFTRDISDRIASEAERRELHSRHESLINCSSSGIIEFDARGKCLFVNNKWCELAGLTRQQALGVGWRQAIHPEDRDGQLRLLQKSLQLGEEFQIDCRMQTPSGVSTWIHGSAVPLTNEANEVTGFLGSISDITALKEAEAVINAARNEAESANRTKSEFLANMSHEMRTPLNGIIGMTDLALDAAMHPDQVECLETVKESAEILLTLTNELLDFAKIEAGKIRLEHVEFNLSEWMNDSLKLLVFRGRQKGLEFSCHTDPSIPKCLVGDPEWLRHILVNLVSNAVKFTDKGFVKVTVAPEGTLAPPDLDETSVLNGPLPAGVSESVVGLQRIRLHFTVQDTGIGIPVEQHESIFAPFEQADKTITRRYGGTGLGLSIARQLSELMQGNIWLESTVGVGTTFHFTICLHVSPLKEIPVPVSRGKSTLRVAKPSFRHEPLNVLVVEDNHINQRLIVKILNQKGHKTSVANNGIEALQILDKGQSFDVVLMDMQMPRLSGLETTAEIRKREANSNRHLPIVALTANVLKGEREKCLSCGMDGYLTKPINRDELFETISKAASRTLSSHSGLLDSERIDLDEPLSNKRITSQSTPEFEAIRAQDTDIVTGRQNSALNFAPLPEPTESSAIDQRALWKRLEGDGELLRELLDGYRDYCPQVLEDLRQAVESQDPILVEYSAHQIKGVVSNFAAAEAYSTARDLERSGRNSDLTNAPDMLSRLEAALLAVDRELEEMTAIVNSQKPKGDSLLNQQLETAMKS